jgi:hypothetical protein
MGLLGAAILPSASADDWPRFRGPEGQGTGQAKGLPIEWGPERNILWKADLPGPGTSSPVIQGHRIFLTCYTGYNVPGESSGSPSDLRRHLVCLDLATGNPVWTRELPAALPEQDTIREGHGYASNTPVADAERVYCFFGKSGVVTFDHDGNELWRAEVGKRLNGWGSAASPVLYDNLLIVNASVESESLVALDKKTGERRWRATGINESWNTPLVVENASGGRELVVAVHGQILAFDPQTGRRMWNCATDIGWYMVPSVVCHEGVVYSIGGRSGIAALAVRTGGKGDVTATHRLWTGNKGSNVSSPVFHEGHLYWVNDSQSIAYCAKAESGEIVYEERVQGRVGQFYASPVLADGKIYYVARNGRTLVVPARPQYEVLALNDLGDGSAFNASPAVAGNRLFIRSDRTLYCIGKE